MHLEDFRIGKTSIWINKIWRTQRSQWNCSKEANQRPIRIHLILQIIFPLCLSRTSFSFIDQRSCWMPFFRTPCCTQTSAVDSIFGVFWSMWWQKNVHSIWSLCSQKWLSTVWLCKYAGRTKKPGSAVASKIQQPRTASVKLGKTASENGRFLWAFCLLFTLGIED